MVKHLLKLLLETLLIYLNSLTLDSMIGVTLELMLDLESLN